MNWSPSVVFPTPVGPVRMLMVPLSSPPCKSSSSSGTPEAMVSRMNCWRCCSGSRCGNTFMPPSVRRTAKVGSPKLGDADRAAFRLKMQVDDAGAHKLEVVIRSGAVPFGGIENGCSLLDQKAQEREHLFAELERIGGEVAKLRHSIEKDPLRLQMLDLLHDLPSHRLAFDFGRRKNIVGLHFGEEGRVGREIQEVDRGEIKPKHVGIGTQFRFRFPQRYKKAALSSDRSFGEKVQAERRFPTSGTAAQEVGALLDEPAI